MGENMTGNVHIYDDYNKAFEAFIKFEYYAEKENLVFTYPCSQCQRITSYKFEEMPFTKNTHGICSECWVEL